MHFKLRLLSFLVIGAMFTQPILAGQTSLQLITGTQIKLNLLETLRSGRAGRNDVVNFKVEEDVVDENGNVLVRKGTPAFGTVLNSRAAGMLGRRGVLDVSADYTTAIDGQKVYLRANKGKSGSGNTGAVTAAAVLVALPLALLRGSNVTINKGTVFNSYVNETLNLPRPGTNSGPAPEKVSASSGVGQEKLIVLKNGNRINGKLISLQNGIYSVETTMGELKITEADILKIEEAEPITDNSEGVNGRENLQQKLDELKSRRK